MSPPGSGDLELLSKTLNFELKIFYLNLRSSPNGLHLKISEKTASTRATIIVPAPDGIRLFLDIFGYYIRTDDRELCSKDLRFDNKVYRFEIGSNRVGRFLKVSDVSASRSRKTFFVPAAYTGAEGWEASFSIKEGWIRFKNVLQEIYEIASRPFTASNQCMGSLQHLPGRSDGIGAGYMSSLNTQLDHRRGQGMGIRGSAQDMTGVRNISSYNRAVIAAPTWGMHVQERSGDRPQRKRGRSQERSWEGARRKMIQPTAGTSPQPEKYASLPNL